MIYVLSNHNAGGDFRANEKRVREMFDDENIEFYMCADVEDKRAFLKNITENDKLVIIGGDGTINKFVNSKDYVDYPFPI